MKDSCKQGFFPELNLIEDTCGGEYKSTNCVISEEGLFPLSIPENSKLQDILEHLAKEVNRLKVDNKSTQEFIEKVKTKIDL